MGTVRVNSIVINNMASTSSGTNGPFYRNSQITSVDLGYTPWTNNNMFYAFYQCTHLTAVNNINPNVTSLHHSFYYCSKLTSAPTIPNSVDTLASTFMDCTALENPPAIPNSVIHMNWTFANCSQLTTAPVIPDSVTNLSSTFSGCRRLTAVSKLSNSATNYAFTFNCCTNLVTAPIIPRSALMVGQYDTYGTFNGCTNLAGNIYIMSTRITSATGFINGTNTEIEKNIYIPYNAALGIQTLTYNYFISAGYSTSSRINGGILKENPYFEKSGDWWWCNYPEDRTLSKYLGSATTLTLPNSINGVSTCISGLGAFGYQNYVYNGSALTSINLNNVPIMDSMCRMFYDCYQLTSITNLNIHSSVTDASFVFNGCTYATSLPSLPDHITNLQCAYTRCTNLTSMPHIPSNAIDLDRIFLYCNFNQWATNITFPDSVVYYSEAFDGYISYVTNKTFNITVGRNAMTLYNAFTTLQGNFYIKSNKVTNASGCFRNASYRKNVYIPFKNSDGTNSATYNSFIAAGYKTDGSYLNTYLYNYTALYS